MSTQFRITVFVKSAAMSSTGERVNLIQLIPSCFNLVQEEVLRFSLSFLLSVSFSSVMNL